MTDKDKDKDKETKKDDIPAIGETWFLGHQGEEYTFEEYEVLSKVGNRTYLVVVIYDVVDNKKRYRIAKTLKGYGEWVQRSAFECHLTLKQYEKMMYEIKQYFNFDVDMLRVYRLTGQAEIQVYGAVELTEDEDLIII